MSKGVSISARISQEDAEFISNLNVDGAKTPSDKVRALISDARKRSLGSNDFAGSFQFFQEVVSPNIMHIREAEFENKIHSDIILGVYEWLPDFFAFLISSCNDKMDANDLQSVEEGVVDRLFRIIEPILLMGLSQRKQLYEATILNDYMQSVIKLTEKIEANISDTGGNKI